MQTTLLILHVFSCLFLIGLILIQKSQGADMGAAFGGASQTVFGSRGPATFLNKLTIVIAVIFLGASLALAHLAKAKSSDSVVEEEKRIEAEQQGGVGQGTPANEGELPPEEKK